MELSAVGLQVQGGGAAGQVRPHHFFSWETFQNIYETKQQYFLRHLWGLHIDDPIAQGASMADVEKRKSFADMKLVDFTSSGFNHFEVGGEYLNPTPVYTTKQLLSYWRYSWIEFSISFLVLGIGSMPPFWWNQINLPREAKDPLRIAMDTA